MRLIACGSCRRQYDVSHHEVGSHVLCVCGLELEVAERPSRDIEARRCAGCGAPYDHDGRECGYCRRVADLDDHNAKSICPECFGRMPEDARFCGACGLAIDPKSLVAVPAGADCPRCEGTLRSRDLGETSVVECAECLGLWLPPKTFDALVEQSGKRGTEHRLKSLDHATAEVAAPRQAFRYLPCPACRDLMVPRNFAGRSGILIDICKSHGIWLDAGELEAVAQFCARRPESVQAEPRPEPLNWMPVPRRNTQAASERNRPRPLLMILNAAEAILDAFGTDIFS